MNIGKRNLFKNKQHLLRVFNLTEFQFCTKEIKSGEIVKFFFKNSKENKVVEVEGIVGQSLVDVSKKYQQDIEAACDQSLACSTCHLILEKEVYNKLDKACDEEEDLLDLAYGLTDTSRLGCQIKVSKLIEGKTFTIPSATKNLLSEE